MQRTSKIFKRIATIVKLKGIKNLPALAKYLGYSTPEKFYRLRRDINAKPSFDMTEDFARKFEDLNMRWFVTGEGKPFGPS
jgi:hypothetical protein